MLRSNVSPAWKPLKVLMVGVALLTLPACGLLAPGVERYLARISMFSEGPDVQVPDTVEVGEPFTFSFLIYRGGCEDFDGTDVRGEGNSRELRPMVRVEQSDLVCPASVLIGRRSVELRFDSPGPATVVLHGIDHDAEPEPEEVALPFEVFVR